MIINKKYSFKNFTGKSFKDVPASEFNNTTIKGSCFAQEIGHNLPNEIVDIFPSSMKGVTFEKCNLDNVKVVANNIIGERCSNRRIQVQNDLEDWQLDNSGNPKEPVDKTEFLKLGLSILPADIPSQKQEKRTTTTARSLLNDS